MKLYVLIFVIPIVTCGCKKFIDVPPSPVQIETSKVFADDPTAVSAVTGLYIQMNQGSLLLPTGGTTLYPALSADELYITGTNANAEQFYTNNLLSTNSVISSGFWSAAYRFIYQANAILEGLASSTGLSEPIRQQLTGEAKFLRAWLYYYLVNLFGDVPLVISTRYTDNMMMGRSGTEAIYHQLENDLADATIKLNAAYPTNGRSRVNRYTAMALLARVYLHSNKWQAAEALASEIISSGMYQLGTDLNTVFLSINPESIWQLTRDNNNTAEAAVFISSSTTVKPAYAFTDTLLSRFESGDKRKASWMKANLISGKNYYYPYKYKARTNTPLSENVVVFRLAEQYLLRAEARLEQGKPDSALADVNKIRGRAGIPLLVLTNSTAIKTAIIKERQTELFTEWGHRWIDLKRTGEAATVLPLLKPLFQQNALLYPIPFTELQKNPFLIQNPGY